MKTALTTLSSIVLAMFVNNVNAAQSKIIYAGSLLVAPEQALKKEQTLIVTHDKIVSIKDGYISKSALNLPDADIINLKNQFVMPGLIDMHVHVTFERDAKANPHRWATEYEADYALRSIKYLPVSLYTSPSPRDS